MNDIKRVLVTGGGIGGLCAAIAFAQRGVEVTLIERRPDFQIPGVGLGQPANALRIYDALGVLDEIIDIGFAYDHMSVFDSQRRLIVHHKFLLGDERVPAFCALARSELHRILLASAMKSGVTVRVGTHVTAIDFSRADCAAVTFSDGSSASYDVMGGFEGIRSTTRELLFGETFAPRYSGIGAWRVQVPKEDEVTGMEFLQGIGGKVGAMPISKDLMYVFNIRPEPAGVFYERDQMPGLFKERLAQFGGYVAKIRDGLDASSDIVYGPIEPLHLPWPWHRGRVVLGGDAAHVAPPHLTQGAAMAAEDGYMLARHLLSSDGTVEQRLMRYGQERYARTVFVYAFARQWMEDEQSVLTPQQMEQTRQEYTSNLANRIAASDRLLNSRII